MSWSEYISTGVGSLAWRLDVGGLPAHFVTMVDMATTSPSLGTARRVTGLSMKGCKTKERIDPIRATLEADGFTPRIADYAQHATLFLGKVGNPSQTTWLRTDLTSSATTVDVSSTTGFASSGYLWIDQECISYTGTSGGNSFTGCTRGVFNTLATAHYIADGAQLRYPAVTNQPLTLEGQRVRLYAYGDADSLTGGGTLVYRGVVGSDARWDGTAWTLGVSSTASLLKQKLGSAFAVEAEARGIYYPASAPWVCELRISDSAAYGPSADVATLTIPEDASATAFFENNDAFADYVNDLIAASDASGWLTTVKCVSDGAAGYHFEATTDSATARAVDVSILSGRRAAAGATGAIQIDGVDGPTLDGAPATGNWVVSRTYIFPATAGLNLVPRGNFYAWNPLAFSYGEASATMQATFPDARIYIGGVTAPPTNASSFTVQWGDDDVETFYPYDASSANYLDVELFESPSGMRSRGRAFVGRTPITFGVVHAVGGVGDFVTALINDTANNVNLGATPDIRNTDWSSSAVMPRRASLPRMSAFNVARRFGGSGKVTLADVISAELQAAGQFVGLTSDGQLAARRIAIPVGSYPSAATLRMLGDDFPRYERQARGTVHTIVLRDNWQSDSDDYIGPEVRVRDVAAFGRCPQGRIVEIERKSSPLDPDSAPPVAQAAALAGKVFGLYGDAYAEVTVQCPTSAWSVTTGSIVRFTSAHIPSTDGTLGVTSKAALVVGREWDMAAGRMTFTLHVGANRLAGYAPSAQVSSNAPVSGNTYDLTVATDEFPSGTTADDWFAADDRVRVWVLDNTTSSALVGSVVSATGNVVRVTFDGAWTPGASTWVLEYAPADEWSTNPTTEFLFVASTASRVELPTSQPAYVFGP